ncbi:hypothetical protein QTP88_021596 [Uroleucon formosanum]
MREKYLAKNRSELQQFVSRHRTVHTHVNRSPLRFYLLPIAKSLVHAAVPSASRGTSNYCNPKSPNLKTNNDTKINKTPPKLKIPTSLPNQMGDLSPSDFSDNEQDWQTVSSNLIKRVRSPGHATSPLSKKDTNIFTSANRFSLLAPSEDDTQLVMEVTEQLQTPIEQPQISTITVTPNPPPIFIESELNFNKFVIKINELTNSSRFECKASSKGLRLQTFNSDSYRAIIKYLRENEVPHHSFQNKEDKPYRVVIRNLHLSTDILYIKSELSALGFQAKNINNARHRQSKLPLPIFFIDLEPDSANSAIFKLSSLCFTKIKVEAPYPKKDIPQCLRCQSYGHTRTYCSHQPRCVRCGDLHDFSLYLKNRSEPAK